VGSERARPYAASPLMFISSLARTTDDEAPGKGDPITTLRGELWALNESDLRRELPAAANGHLTWVAEHAERQLCAEPDKLRVVDRLIDVLRASAYYVCILAGHSRDRDGHGTPVPHAGEATAVSYFEVELYAAAMYAKPLFVYVLNGFQPGERLAHLLELLKWAIPDWRVIPPQSVKEILTDVERRIRQHGSKPHRAEPLLRRHLVRALWRGRAGPAATSPSNTGLLFLGGVRENRPLLPEPERVQALICAYRDVPNYQQKLNRIWIAARELMPASYHPDDVRRRPALADLLPYWDAVLGDWAAAASWHGWHGHLYVGTVAPLQSQMLLRSQTVPRRDEMGLEMKLPPDGALASAYYSIAGLLGFGHHRWQCLRRAGQHVRRAIEARGGPTDNLLAIRGSIRLQLGWWPGAVSDFRRMLRLREASGASPQKIADAQMHLGFAYALCPLSSSGLDLLCKSVETFAATPDDPNLPRAKKKLALAYFLRCRPSLGRRYKLEAAADAARTGALDQAR
jgi:hypothetical protein